MSAREVLERFEANLNRDPELATLVRMIAPYRVMLGQPEGVVQLLDRLAVAYADARGHTLTPKEETR